MVRIGANPICWSNDDMPEIGADISLEQCLREASEIGYEGMELGNKMPRKAKKLAALLGGYGLDFVSGWYSSELLERNVKAEMKALKGHATLLADLGATQLVLAETSHAIHGDIDMPLSARPILETSGWREFGDRLSDLSTQVMDLYGLQVVYHHHMGTIVQSEAEIDRLMEVTGDQFHLLLDTGHATWGGADPARLARHYKSRISHVHTKDVREEEMWLAQRKDQSFLASILSGVYTVPGDGIIDYAPVFDALEGYEGWVIVEAEQDSNTIDTQAYAKLGYDNVRAMLVESGLLT